MGRIIAIAISGSGANGTLSAAGTVAVNVMAQNTDARITNAVVETDGNVSVDSTNTSFIGAFAGGIAATLRTAQPNNAADSTNSVGAGIAINVISNDLGDRAGTLARIENSQVDAGLGGTILVDAMTTSTIWAAAVGLAFNTGGPIAQSSNAVGFSLGVNVISTKTQAGTRGKNGAAGLTAGGATSVTSTDTSAIRAISGAGRRRQRGVWGLQRCRHLAGCQHHHDRHRRGRGKHIDRRRSADREQHVERIDRCTGTWVPLARVVSPWVAS